MALTWRDTATPDQSAAVGFSRLSADAMNRGFQAASDGLGQFHQWQQGQAASALANNEANYTNAADQLAAQKSGALFTGVDRGNLTPQALGSINTNASSMLANAADQAKLPYVGPAAAAGINLTNSQSGNLNASANATNQNTAEQGTLFGRGSTAYNANVIGQAAGIKAASSAQTPADVIAAVDADPTVANNPMARQAAIEHGMALLNGTYNPANAQIAAAAGAGAMPSGSNNFYSTAMQQESGGRNIPNAGGGSASGYYQITDGTWNDVRSAHPELKLPANVLDATYQQQTDGYKALVSGNVAALQKAGIPVNDRNAYMTSFLGAGGGTKFIQAMGQDPTQNAAAAFPKEAKSNPTIFYNTDAAGKPILSQPRTMQQVYDKQTSQFSDGNSTGFGTASAGSSGASGDPMNDFYTSLGNATRVSSDISAKVGQLQSSGISGVYGDASRSNLPSQQVVDGLLATKDFASVGPEKIKAGMDAIKQIGAKYNLSLNDSEAGAILSENASSDPVWFKSWRGNTDNLNLNNDAVDAEVKQIAQGSREKQLQQVNQATNSAAVVDQLKQAASDAFQRWRQASAVAAQRPETAGSVEPVRKAYLQVKTKLDQAVAAAQQNSNLKPVFPMSGNIAPPGSGNNSGKVSGNGAPAALSKAVQGESPSD